MNAEIARIRENKDMSEEIRGKVERIPESNLVDLLYQMNMNMTNLSMNGTANIDDYIETYAENIYIILDILSEMNAYPDYFFDVVFRRNIDFTKSSSKKTSPRDIYRENMSHIRNYNDLIVDKKIQTGLENGYYKPQAYKNGSANQRDISDYFTEMIGYYQVFDFPYNNNTLEQCRKSNNEIQSLIWHFNTSLASSSLEFDDIQYMMNLLFIYISFFVEIGVNPKEYIDKLIEEKKEINKLR